MKKLSLIAGLLMGVLATSTLVNAAEDAPARPNRPRTEAGQPGGPGGQRQTPEARLNTLAERLSLTEDQKAKVKELLKKETAKMQELRQDSSLDAQARRTKMREIREQGDKDMKALLKPEQVEKWEKLRQEQPTRGQRGQRGQGQP